MLRRLHKQAVEVDERKLGRKRSKRQRIAEFFRSRKQKPQDHNEVPAKTPTVSEKLPQATPQETSPVVVTTLEKSSYVDREKTASLEEIKEPAEPSPSEAPAALPAPETPETKEAEKVEPLSVGQLHILFAGAPHFSVKKEHGRPISTASYPWAGEGITKDTTDSVRPEQPAFSVASMHTHPPATQQPPSSEHKQYRGYKVDVVEMPDMLSARGIEPGSIGFKHYLELPIADSLVTDLEDSQSSKDFLQGTRNKELMQTTPERIGIRAVDMGLVYDRLIEFQDLYEAFHDSPGLMTILNNQSAGDLYANLFSKFLTPPGYDGTADDPTGLRIQIVTLMRILKLKGVWYNFSLVEWRIRLGQILWSDPEPVPEHEPHPLWTEREVLLLQITLACELLLRLDAVSIAEAKGEDSLVHVSEQEIRSFFGTKTRKLDWDLVFARRFLDNILVVKNSEPDTNIKSHGFLSKLGVSKEPEPPRSDIVLLPQNQARQIAGLIHFAETIQWPNTQALMQELVQKLGIHDGASQIEQLPSPDQIFLDPITPASISVYGTPLQTPRPANHMLDGYFGHVGKPALSRDTSHSLRIPLSPTLSPVDGHSGSALSNVGGWLSRSYLTGLVLPGEAISHFLISTLLENDRAAIASLGDSANLYGGFSYAERAWWSKNSIVGRVFACVEGAVECMGWISFPKLPDGLIERWHSIYSEQLPSDNRLYDTTRSSAVTQDSAIIPNDALAILKSEDLILPQDAPTPSTTVTFVQWELTPLNPDLIDNDALSGPPTEGDIHIPSLTFTSQGQAVIHTMTLAFDVQFVSSWPCNTPASTLAPSMPQLLRRSLTGTMSRSSSKRSGSVRLSRRNSHGFEPLLSHPPDSTDIAPKPMYMIDTEDDSDAATIKRQPLDVHPLHASYKYKIVPIVDVLNPEFVAPFDIHAHTSRALSPSSSGIEVRQDDNRLNDKKTILVLDARGSADLQLLARAWCAEKGYHAIIGRVGRTCLACCIREARGLGVHIVIRV